MKRDTTLPGVGVSSGKPFYIRIQQVEDAVWVTGIHSSRRVTMVAICQADCFYQLIKEAVISEPDTAFLAARRSVGGQTVELQLRVAGDVAYFVMKDASGKTTNATKVRVRDLPPPPPRTDGLRRLTG